MKRFSRMLSKTAVVLLVAALLVSSFAVCLADTYSEYFNAYVALMENGLVDANLDVTLSMDGSTSNYTGNMKIDANKNLMYYEMNCDGNSIITFTDGSYLYTEVDGEKVMYNMNQEGGDDQAEPAEPEGVEDQSKPEFTVQDFISNFSSMLEPGKIAELGLLSPIPQAGVTDTSKDGNVYTLKVAESIAKAYLNTISADNIEDGGDTITFPTLDNLTYKATVEGGVVTGVVYAADLGVHVPGSLMSSGSDADYQMNFTINITFNNPGNESEFELPSTDGFTEVQPDAMH